MAATNYTPIQLYYSSTASAAPTAGNLTSGELAINITDGKLYYKDNGGVVQVIATKGAGTIGGSTTQIQYNNAGALAGSASMTFNSGTNVTTLTTLNLTNALGATYGGTAQSAYAQGDVLYASATNTLSKLGIGTVNYILTSTGSVPQWVAPTSITVNTANNLAGGAGGSVPYQSAADTTTFLAIGAANRVMTSSGSVPQWVTALTGLTGVSSSSITNTSLTSGRVVYSGASGVETDSASLTFNGTTLSAGGFSTTGLSTLVQTVTVGNSNFSGTAVFAASTPAKLYIGTGTVTDTTSAIGATNTTGAISSLAITPIAATNTSVTYTNASTLYIAGAPSAGTNVTLTNPYALYVAAGNSYFGGTVTYAGGINFNGNVTVGDSSADTLTINSTITSNLIFTDNTYDIGASGATRPRNLYLAGNAIVGGAIRIGAATSDELLTINGSSAGFIARITNTTASNPNGLYVNSTNAIGTGTAFRVDSAGTSLLTLNTTGTTLAGTLGVGASASASNGINVNSTNLTGVYQVGVQAAPVGTSAATAGVFSVYAFPSTAAASFVSGQVAGVYCENAAKGAGSTITNQYGVYIAEQSRGDNNFGVSSNVSAATGRWNIYAAGTATNYFNGDVRIGTTGSISAEKLFVDTTGNKEAVHFRNSSTTYRTGTFENTNAAFTDSVLILKSATTGSTAYKFLSLTANGTEVGYVAGDGTTLLRGILYVGTPVVTTTAQISTSGSMVLGAGTSTTGDFLSSGGGNSSTYNGLAILSNSKGIATQSNTSLPSWIVDIGGRAADGSTYNVNTANKFRVAYVAAGGSYYSATNLLSINSGGQAVINNDTTVLDTAMLTINCTAGTGSTIPLSLRAGVTSDGYGMVNFRNQAGVQGSIACNTSSISLSGVSGITFPATQVPSADPNTLDDYETGSWTPSIPGVTVTGYDGKYTKVGNLVHFWGRVSTSSGTSTVPRIGGLPFTTSANSRSGMTVSQANNCNYGVGATTLVGFINTNYMDLFGNTNNSPYTTMPAGWFVGGSSFIEFSGTYIVY